MPTIIDGSASATFATPLPLLQGGTGNTSGNVVSSQVAGALNATGSAPLYACRAWVNFNGTGTVAIRASGNVSSITDNGIGDYTVNFATAMPDANYAVQGMCQDIELGGFNGDMGVITLIRSALNTAQAAGSVRLTTTMRSTNFTTLVDMSRVLVSIFR